MYYPFAKSLDKLEHSDIELFCKQGVSENLYLDYKQEIKADKLSQSIASFANTKGGILLIGVSEDKTTKLPSKWDGIDDTGTLSETVNQIISNVTPYPTCRFAVVPHTTKGKAFLVVIVEEGASAPYFTVHKPIVYVRTGDVSTPISESNRADLMALTERGEKADAKIYSSLELADSIFFERYKRAKENFKLEQKDEKPTDALSAFVAASRIDIDYEDIGGYSSPLVISSIIPRNPDELTDHKTLLDKQLDFRYSRNGATVPSQMLDPVRYGLATSGYNNQAFNISSKRVRYTYVNKFGLVQLRRELNDISDGTEYQNLFKALWSIADTIRYASTFYTHFGYSGSLRLNVQLENLEKEWLLLGSQNIMFDVNTVEIDLTSYDWTADFSTHDLTTDKAKIILTQLFTDIYLDLGFPDIAPEASQLITDFKL